MKIKMGWLRRKRVLCRRARGTGTSKGSQTVWEHAVLENQSEVITLYKTNKTTTQRFFLKEQNWEEPLGFWKTPSYEAAEWISLLVTKGHPRALCPSDKTYKFWPGCWKEPGEPWSQGLTSEEMEDPELEVAGSEQWRRWGLSERNKNRAFCRSPGLLACHDDKHGGLVPN